MPLTVQSSNLVKIRFKRGGRCERVARMYLEGGVNKSIHKKDGVEDFPSCSVVRAPCFDRKRARVWSTIKETKIPTCHTAWLKNFKRTMKLSIKHQLGRNEKFPLIGKSESTARELKSLLLLQRSFRWQIRCPGFQQHLYGQQQSASNRVLLLLHWSSQRVSELQPTIPRPS